MSLKHPQTDWNIKFDSLPDDIKAKLRTVRPQVQTQAELDELLRRIRIAGTGKL